MTDIILVMNAGSSSIKFAIYPATATNPEALIRGKIAGIGNQPDFMVHDDEHRDMQEGPLESIEPSATHGDLTLQLLQWIAEHTAGYHLKAVGHRVVHGGVTYREPVLIEDTVMQTLESLVSLAPLHQPNNLAVIRAITERFPELAQIACFDTSFHRSQPRLAQLFALPRSMTDAGIIRYGFHGISYEYIAGRLPEVLGPLAEGRVIVAHLGNGSSMCAMKDRRSVATSMGFTALDGLMMGRRCGTLDAGVVLHMLDQMAMSSEDVARVLYHESGLLGVSGVSNDMKVLDDSPNPHAREAMELYCYRAAAQLASLACDNQGLDAIVFTAGIGENSATIRRMITERLAWLGVSLDASANESNAARISDKASRVQVHVIPTNEEVVIAEAVRKTLR